MARSAQLRSVVLGVDGSPHSRRAAAFLARLVPRPRGRVAVIMALEPVRPPSLRLLPSSVRGRIMGELARLEQSERARARKIVDTAAAAIAARGWRVKASVRLGAPVPELLAAVRQEKADLLVIGGRGAGGFKRLLLGSVAEGCLKHAPASVLVVK